MGRQSESGLPVEPVYGPGQPPGFDPATQLGSPGEFPFTRGIYPGMYTTRPWTIRQYAGFATARESNERYHQLIAAGTTGLSVAFDLPTQMGYDSDAPAAHGEVGKVGVAIDSVADMAALLDRIPLDQVSTSMTINAPAAVLLLLYQLVAERQNIAAAALTGTIQNDVLKEYIARGTYIYPPEPSLRLVADTFAYCRRRDAPLAPHLDLRVPHGGGGGHARAGDRVHAGQREGVRPGGARARASRWTTSPRACRSSSWPGPPCSKRSPSSAPRAGCGPRSCGTSSARPTRARRCCGSTPRPLACS